jgi:rhamnosyltransferase
VLDSVFSQIYKNIEVIIVDSGSTDDTLKVVKKYPVKLIQIKSEKFNFSYALNLGISRAKGELICVISAHSIPISKSWLRGGVKYFKDSKVAAVTGHTIELPFGYYSKFLGNMAYKIVVNKEKNSHWPWMTNTNSIIRKDLWKKYPFDESLKNGCEDYDWALEMLARGHKVVKEPGFSVHHSHLALGRKPWFIRKAIWMKLTPAIEKRKRPRKSFTRIKNLS